MLFSGSPHNNVTCCLVMAIRLQLYGGGESMKSSHMVICQNCVVVIVPFQNLAVSETLMI